VVGVVLAIGGGLLCARTITRIDRPRVTLAPRGERESASTVALR